MNVKPMPTGYEVSAFTEADIGDLLGLIKELAIYEDLESEAVATETLIRESLLGEKASAKVEMVRHGEETVGFCLYFYNYSTFLGKNGIYLEDLYIKENHRGKGLGSNLIKHLAKKVVDMGGGRLDWACLKCNDPSLQFYDLLGAKRMDEWVSLRLEGDALHRLA